MNTFTPRPPQPNRKEKGQILIFLALAFVGLLAFIGLAMDVGILFINMGHLRRAVDSAALAASAQFREGRTYTEIRNSAIDFFELNQGPVVPTDVLVETCLSTDPNMPNPGLCPDPPRKFVRVTADADVPFTFLSLIGWNSVSITANAVSEAASLDVVMILDTSESMAFDASCSDGDTDDDDLLVDDCGDEDGDGLVYGETTSDPAEACEDWGADCVPDDFYREPNECNTDSQGWDPGDGIIGECHPFEEVKVAAMSFIDNLNAGFDRVSVVTFAQTAVLQYPLQTNLANARTTVENLNVSFRPGPPDCAYPASPDPSPCTSTSIGGGMRAAAAAFSQPLGGPNNIREESLWVAILLTDGAANASIPDDVDGDPVNLHCPPSTWPPWPPVPPQPPACRDSSATTRHSILNTGKFNPNNSYDPSNYDTDDYARDMADLLACPTQDDPPFDPWCYDSLNFAADEGGQNALIFTIGLGDLVTSTAYGDPDAGEQLLRYTAGVGVDGFPNPNYPTAGEDNCLGVPSGQSCGNYYFSPSGAQLITIFEEIASRIFTRLTQ
jgi:hypothetical protein